MVYIGERQKQEQAYLAAKELPESPSETQIKVIAGRRGVDTDLVMKKHELLHREKERRSSNIGNVEYYYDVKSGKKRYIIAGTKPPEDSIQITEKSYKLGKQKLTKGDFGRLQKYETMKRVEATIKEKFLQKRKIQRPDTYQARFQTKGFYGLVKKREKDIKTIFEKEIESKSQYPTEVRYYVDKDISKDVRSRQVISSGETMTRLTTQPPIIKPKQIALRSSVGAGVRSVISTKPIKQTISSPMFEQHEIIRADAYSPKEKKILQGIKLGVIDIIGMPYRHYKASYEFGKELGDIKRLREGTVKPFKAEYKIKQENIADIRKMQSFISGETITKTTNIPKLKDVKSSIASSTIGAKKQILVPTSTYGADKRYRISESTKSLFQYQSQPITKQEKFQLRRKELYKYITKPDVAAFYVATGTAGIGLSSSAGARVARGLYYTGISTQIGSLIYKPTVRKASRLGTVLAIPKVTKAIFEIKRVAKTKYYDYKYSKVDKQIGTYPLKYKQKLIVEPVLTESKKIIGWKGYRRGQLSFDPKYYAQPQIKTYKTESGMIIEARQKFIVKETKQLGLKKFLPSKMLEIKAARNILILKKTNLYTTEKFNFKSYGITPSKQKTLLDFKFKPVVTTKSYKITKPMKPFKTSINLLRDKPRVVTQFSRTGAATILKPKSTVRSESFNLRSTVIPKSAVYDPSKVIIDYRAPRLPKINLKEFSFGMSSITGASISLGSRKSTREINVFSVKSSPSIRTTSLLKPSVSTTQRLRTKYQDILQPRIKIDVTPDIARSTRRTTTFNYDIKIDNYVRQIPSQSYRKEGGGNNIPLPKTPRPPTNIFNIETYKRRRRKSKRKKSRTIGRTFRYVGSIVPSYFGIKGKKPLMITGFSRRPLLR